MYERLKSFGQILGGFGLLSVAIIYWSEVSKANSQRVGEQRGLLMMISTEIAINQQGLARLSEEPHRLADGTFPLFRTTAWDQYQPRIAQFLWEQPVLTTIESYYQELLSIRESVHLGVTGGEEAENLRHRAQWCQELGYSIPRELYTYITRLQAQVSPKPG